MFIQIDICCWNVKENLNEKKWPLVYKDAYVEVQNDM